MEEQLKVCHAIIVNKMDLIDNEAKENLKVLKKLNPHAAITYTFNCSSIKSFVLFVYNFLFKNCGPSTKPITVGTSVYSAISGS